MRIASWNVNGIRSVCNKGFSLWLEKSDADVVCLQEVKATEDCLGEEIKAIGKYGSVWYGAEKKGYSGLAIYHRKAPTEIITGIGDPLIDREARVLQLDYPGLRIINSYFPNSQRDHARLPYKLAFCKKMLQHLQEIRAQGKHVLLCGDLNIAHQEIDLRNPKQNQDNAGFLPEERAWMTDLLSNGFIDGFREFNKEGGHYTWWSYRPTIRERNIGWRLDYFIANEEFRDKLKNVQHQTEVMGSDHCPVLATIR